MSKSMMTINRTYKEGGFIRGEEEEHEEIEVRTMPDGCLVAQIGYNGRATINMGDFNSTQIGISLVLPAPVEEIEDAYEAAKKFVDMRMGKEVAEARKAAKGVK